MTPPPPSLATPVKPAIPIPEPRSEALIGKSVVINGTVIGSEDLTINGTVEGRIELKGHHLTIGAGATIKAALLARIVTIHGVVTGDVVATEKIVIKETGQVEGEISGPRIAISDGATIRGRIEVQTSRHTSTASAEQPLAVAV